MTPERAKELTEDPLLNIVRAFAAGETIQKRVGADMWVDDDDPDWLGEYRIKPEPKVIYVNEYDETWNDAFEHESDAIKSAQAGAKIEAKIPDRVAVKYIEASD